MWYESGHRQPNWEIPKSAAAAAGRASCLCRPLAVHPEGESRALLILTIPAVALCGLAPLLCGCFGEPLPLQIAPYAEITPPPDYIPLMTSEHVVMTPGQKIPVMWADLCILELRYTAEEENAFPDRKYDNNQYKFVFSPSADEYQKGLRQRLTLADKLDFSEQSLSMEENSEKTTYVQGVASVTLKVDNTWAKSGGVRIDVLKISLDKDLLLRLQGHARVTTQQDGKLRLEWDENPRTETRTEKKTATMKWNPTLNEAKRCIEMELVYEQEFVETEVTTVDRVTEIYRSTTPTDAFGKPRLREVALVQKPPREKTRRTERLPTAGKEVTYRIAGLQNRHPGWQGELQADSEGRVVLDLAPYVDMGVTMDLIEFEFTLDGETQELTVPREKFVQWKTASPTTK